jgi:putative hydrolase of the HAD superfamily
VKKGLPVSISIPGRVVVFDYGEVISHAPDERDRRVLELEAGVCEQPERARAFWAAYDTSRDALDQGTLTIVDYWRGIAQAIGERFSDVQITRLWLADFRSWLTVNDETLDLLAELRAGGTRMALLSNAGRDFGSYFRDGVLGGFFEAAFVSGELGVLKPHAEIFEIALAQLGISPHEMIFIDNKEVNVRGATALGIEGHTFHDAVGLRRFLETLAA